MKKYFYLKDHLGNIRVTVDENGDVKGYNDYYPFGLQMPGRSMNNALSTDMYKYSSKELDEEGLAGYAPFSVRMISKGFLDGNAAAIYVNDSYISDSGLYARGYTIVVVDENGTVVDKAHFDTYSSTAEADAMADFINSVPEGQYVIGVIKDDGSQSMTEDAYNALASVGCQHSREVGFRYSYAFIGKKGESSCGYEAYAPAGQGFVDKRIGESQSLAWYYFGARYYDPEIGRWLSVDPLTHKYPSYSPYNYVLNNPLKYKDPKGRSVTGSLVTADLISPDPTDLLIWKWVGYGAAFIVEAYIVKKFIDNKSFNPKSFDEAKKNLNTKNPKAQKEAEKRYNNQLEQQPPPDKSGGNNNGGNGKKKIGPWSGGGASVAAAKLVEQCVDEKKERDEAIKQRDEIINSKTKSEKLPETEIKEDKNR
ncbi:interleukin-like EMT inducer domain-containing protein [Calditrichota bacterium LG25]